MHKDQPWSSNSGVVAASFSVRKIHVDEFINQGAMQAQVYESGNRRAEVRPSNDDLLKLRVSFQRMAGRVRRSRYGIWHVDVDDARMARQLAGDWAFRVKLPHRGSQMLGIVYFLFDRATPRIKIGSSERPLSRLFAHGKVIVVDKIYFMPGVFADEKRLQAQFAHLAIKYSRKKGAGPHKGDKGVEWFRAEPELREFIFANAKPWDDAATFLWEGKQPSFAMRGSIEWVTWLEELAKESDLSVGGLVEQALATFSQSKRIREPPARLPAKLG